MKIGTMPGRGGVGAGGLGRAGVERRQCAVGLKVDFVKDRTEGAWVTGLVLADEHPRSEEAQANRIDDAFGRSVRGGGGDRGWRTQCPSQAGHGEIRSLARRVVRAAHLPSGA